MRIELYKAEKFGPEDLWMDYADLSDIAKDFRRLFIDSGDIYDIRHFTDDWGISGSDTFPKMLKQELVWNRIKLVDEN